RFVSALLSGLRADVRSGPPPSTLYVEHLAALVLLRLARLPETGKTLRHARPPDAKRVERVRQYVHSHLPADLSRGDLAEAVSLPVVGFARCFGAATGRAPYAYVLEKRVARAEHLLRTSRLSLSQIAQNLGFSSQSHFTSAFRKVTGLTPNAYRRTPSA